MVPFVQHLYQELLIVLHTILTSVCAIPKSFKYRTGSALMPAAFVPNLLVMSQPVNACVAGRNLHTGFPIFTAITWTLRGQIRMCSVRRNSVPGQAIGASLQKIWKSHSLPISTKMQLVKVLVWPVTTYACESWTLRKNEEITSWRLWDERGMRQILRVSRTSRKTNEWVLNKPGVNC